MVWRPGRRGTVTLMVVIPAAIAAAVIGASAFGASRSSVAAETPSGPLAREGAPTHPTVTFSPRSSLARLDLRNGRVHRLGARGFFAVAHPSLSPTGRVAFIGIRCASCRQRLVILRGRRVRSLASALSATWLNDTRLLASVGRGEDTEVWALGLNGRGHELEWLTDSTKSLGVETERELAVSTDERTLLFSGEGSGEHHRNFLVDLRSHRLLPLSGDAEDAPSFSLSGRAIAYQQVSRAGDWDLCVATISMQEADRTRCLRSPGGNDREPVFLPNGHELVFSSDRAAHRSGASSLYLLNLRTGSVRRLTASGYDALNPAVARSGHSVVFVRRALLPLR